MINKFNDYPTFGLFNNFELIRKMIGKINEVIDKVNEPAPEPTPSGINYSTEEQDTGITWLDDKTIYQKTYVIADLEGVTTSNPITLDEDIHNSFNLIKFEGLLNYANDNDEITTKSFCGDGGHTNTTAVWVEKHNVEGTDYGLYLYCATMYDGTTAGATIPSTCAITVYYTKNLS